MVDFSRSNVLVVGAGPAGLAAASFLERAQIDYDLVDSQKHVGGVFSLTTTGSAWPEMELTSSKALTEFDELRMPVSFPTFPTAQQYGTYLRAFAAHTGADAHFHPRTEVRMARSFGEGNWEVSFSTGEVRTYGAIIAAHGTSSQPHLPAELVADLEDAGVPFIHASQYRGAAHTQAENVLVIGSDQAAADIAADLADADRSVQLLWEEGRWIVPRSLGHLPADAIAQLEPSFLGRLNETIARGAARRTIGSAEAVGLPRPSAPLLDSEPVVSDRLIRDLEQHRIRLVRDRRHLPLDAFDLVILATGYETGAPYLAPELAQDLFLGAFPRSRRDLVVLGQLRVAGSLVPVLEDQAELAALYLRAQRSDPAAAEAFDRLRAQTITVSGDARQVPFMHREQLLRELDRARAVFSPSARR